MSVIDFPVSVEPTWDDRACKGMDPDWFHPTFREDEAEVVAFCRNHCPVIVECQRRSRDEPHGVWGGLTAEERRVARRKRMRKS